MKKVLLTREYLDELKGPIMQSLIERKQEIAAEIGRTKDFGDTSENAEYHAALEEQSNNYKEIERIQEMINNHEIVEIDYNKSDEVQFTSQVKIKYLDDNEEVEVTVVPKVAPDPLNGRISNESPLGQALMGRKKGSVVKVHTNDGFVEVEIIDVTLLGVDISPEVANTKKRKKKN